MTEFDYEVFQRKSLARAARYVKNGSKSKKCTLPSDALTAAQRNKMNGVVKRYMENLNQPISWKVFKTLSIESQREYIANINNNFNVRATDIATMFNISANTFLHYNAAHELGFEVKRGGAVNIRERNRFYKAFSPAQPAPETEVDDTEEVVAVFEPEPEMNVVEAEPVPECPVKVDEVLTPNSIRFVPIESIIKYNGVFSADNLIDTLRTMIPDGSAIEMEISFKVSNEVPGQISI